jgi:hypothetical protein
MAFIEWKADGWRRPLAGALLMNGFPPALVAASRAAPFDNQTGYDDQNNKRKPKSGVGPKSRMRRLGIIRVGRAKW